MRAAPAVALLLLLALPVPHGAPQVPPGAGDPWVITGPETCNDRLVVDRNITIEAGGSLTLQGCSLVMKSFPYVANHFSPVDLGLSIRVKQGGALVMAALPGHPSEIVPDDARYGYTVKSQGVFASIGLPDTWNRISGLEGAHEGNLVLGGLQMTTARFQYTKFDGNYGPVYITTRGNFTGEHLDFARGGGIAAIRARSVHVSNITMVTGNTGIFTSLSNLTVEDCSITGGRKSVYLVSSNASIRRCSFELGPYEGVGLYATDSRVEMADTNIHYSQVGIQLLVKGKTGALPNRLALDRVNITGYSPNATSSLEVQQTALRVRDSTLSSLGVMLHSLESDVDLQGNRMSGNASLVINPRSLRFLDNQAPDPAFEVLRITRVEVQDKAGTPLKGLLVDLPGSTGRTSDLGFADVLWHWFKGTSADGLGGHDKATLRITDPATNKTASYSENANSNVMRVTFPPQSSFPWPTVFLVALGVAVVAVALWAWRSPGKKA